MTRKDYALIANAIDATLESAEENERQGGDLDAKGALNMLMQRLADDLADENPRFDRGRFFAACGF